MDEYEKKLQVVWSIPWPWSDKFTSVELTSLRSKGIDFHWMRTSHFNRDPDLSFICMRRLLQELKKIAHLPSSHLLIEMQFAGSLGEHISQIVDWDTLDQIWSTLCDIRHRENADPVCNTLAMISDLGAPRHWVWISHISLLNICRVFWYCKTGKQVYWQQPWITYLKYSPSHPFSPWWMEMSTMSFQRIRKKSRFTTNPENM